MLIRDADGKLNIVFRSKCKNETVYNEKIYLIRNTYNNKYKNVFINPPKVSVKYSKNLSDD